MKYLIWLILFTIAGFVLFHAAKNPAYLLIVYPPYRIELSLTLSIIILLFAYLISYSFLRLSIHAFRMPASLRAHKAERVRNIQQGLLQQMLHAWLEGRTHDTISLSTRLLEQDKQNYLATILAARAEQQLGNQARCAEYLQLAQQNAPAQTDLYQITAAHCLLTSNPEQVIELLTPLKHRPHSGALPLLFKAEMALQQREAAEETLELMKKQQLVSELEYQNQLDQLSKLLISKPIDAQTLQ